MNFEVVLLGKAKNFIESLDNKMKAKIYKTIDLLRQFGFNLKLPFCDYVNKDLKELRVKQGSNICRLFYFYYQNKTYVILSGYVKKDMKLNVNEINKAMELKRLFIEQNK